MSSAVLLIQFGGPEKEEDLFSFLYRLFKEPEILPIRPSFLRSLVAAAIAFSRRKEAARIYREIGWSKIREATLAKRDALARLLEKRADLPDLPLVVAAMTCSEPFVETAVEALAKGGVERALALPLYPQYSTATSGVALRRVRQAGAKVGLRFSEARDFYREPGFIEAHADLIEKELAEAPDGTHILYSAHSLPESLVKRGDPYPEQVEATVRLVNRRLSFFGSTSLAYQSKLGPVRWIGPSTEEEIEKLARQGVGALLVVPIAFVSEHVETLYEIQGLYRDLAKEAGIAWYRQVPAIGIHPAFMQALGSIVRRFVVSEGEFAP